LDQNLLHKIQHIERPDESLFLLSFVRRVLKHAAGVGTATPGKRFLAEPRQMILLENQYSSTGQSRTVKTMNPTRMAACLVLVLCASALSVGAATITVSSSINLFTETVSSFNWNDVSTWEGGVVPTANGTRPDAGFLVARLARNIIVVTPPLLR
jgi:hypothetical protein